MTVDAAPALSLPEICAEARRCPCGHCWAERGVPCVTHPDTGAEGFHMARFCRAYRRGLLSDADIAAVLYAANRFTYGSVVYVQEAGHS